MIAAIHVSTLIQSLCVLVFLSYTNLRRILCTSHFPCTFPNDSAILQHIGIICVSLILAALGLHNYFFDDFRGTCGIAFNPQRSPFQILFLVFKWALVILILCTHYRAFKGSLRNKALIHPLEVGPKKSDFRADFSVTKSAPPAKIRTFREKINGATGTTSNGNTKSTEVGSCDDSLRGSEKCSCSAGDSMHDRKQSYDSTKLINTQQKEKLEGRASRESKECPDCLDGPTQIGVKPKLQSTRYRDPNSFDSETENGDGQHDQIAVSSAVPGGSAVLEERCGRETSFCLEVEDLRTGKRIRTNNIKKTLESSPVSKKCNSDVNKSTSMSQVNDAIRHELIEDFCLDTSSEAVLGSMRSGNRRSSTLATCEVNENIDAEASNDTFFFRRLRRMVAPCIRTLGCGIKRSNRISAQDCCKQSNCYLSSTKPFHLDESFESEECCTNAVPYKLHSHAWGRECAVYYPEEDAPCNCNGAKHRPFVPKEFNYPRVDVCQFANEKQSYESVCISHHESKPVPMLLYSPNARRHYPHENVLRGREDIPRFTYTVPPWSRGNHHKIEGILRPSSIIQRKMAKDRQLTMLIFAINCAYILLSAPLLSLELLSILDIWKRTKTGTVIVDVVNDLTNCIVPIICGFFYEEYRREIFSLFTKKLHMINR